MSVQALSLVRVSRHSSGEPHFGKSGVNRFDDPSLLFRFGTCYLGENLTVAVSETVLHDKEPVNGQFQVATVEASRRYAVAFAGGTLNLADMTGAALKRSGASSLLSTCDDYRIPQAWSRAIHTHPAKVDGILYMSKNLNSHRAVVLYDRAASKLAATIYTPLLSHADMTTAIRDLGITWI